MINKVGFNVENIYQSNPVKKSFEKDKNETWKSLIERMDEDKNVDEEQKNQKIGKIRAKLTAGKKLSGKELDFLRKYAPELYETAKRVTTKRESISRRLRSCKSKEEVNDVIRQATESISDKDPDKEYLTAAIRCAGDDFKKKDSFKNLPATRAEAAEKSKKGKKTKNASSDDDSEDEDIFSSENYGDGGELSIDSSFDVKA